MKYNAYIIKAWLIQTISPLGWSTLISRALPELLEVNHRFSAYYVGKNTKWGMEEVAVIRWYLEKLYQIDLPVQVLEESITIDFSEVFAMTFFDTKLDFQKVKNVMKRILRIA